MKSKFISHICLSPITFQNKISIVAVLEGKNAIQHWQITLAPKVLRDFDAKEPPNNAVTPLYLIVFNVLDNAQSSEDVS